MTEQRERADRATEERQQRRRRDDTTIDGGQRQKLRVPPDVEARLKAEGRTAYWAIKDSARMFELTQSDDYDRVDGVDEISTRSLADGQPIKMVLLSKPTAFVNEDKGKLEAQRIAKEQAMTDASQLAPGQYLDEASKITHGGHSP